jgi:cytoskeleton protein RodZ
MSDVAASEGAAAHGDPAEPATQAPADERMSAGALLRQAREAAGVDLASLAVALKVSPKKLESLEADRLDLLPDAVFVRALASSVCRALKIDAAPVLARLPQSATPRLDRDQVSLNTPFQSPGDVAKVPFLDRLSRPMVLAALAVLLGALVLIFFPSSEQRAEIGAIVARPAAQPPVAPPAATVAAAPAASAPVPVPVPVPAVASAAPAKPAAPAPQPAARPAATAAAGAPDATPVSGEAPVRKRVSSTGVVVFKTTGPSWVEVTDGNGAVQLSRMVEPGDAVGASGPLPLNVTVGRADVTEVTVRGQPFPLEPVTRQGVARFEVK